MARPLRPDFLLIFRRGKHSEGRAIQMNTAYGAVCLMCGRNLGRVVSGRFFVRPGSPLPERDGQCLRCGHCRGSIVFEPDASLSQPDWVAQRQRDEAADPAPRRVVRRQAG